LEWFVFADAPFIYVFLEIGKADFLDVSVVAVARQQKATQQSYRARKQEDSAPVKVVIVPEISRVLVLRGPGI
jgi:hypothetical protein